MGPRAHNFPTQNRTAHRQLHFLLQGELQGGQLFASAARPAWQERATTERLGGSIMKLGTASKGRSAQSPTDVTVSLYN